MPHRRVEASEVVLLDVCRAGDYAAGHLPGAMAMPADEQRRRLADLPAILDLSPTAVAPIEQVADER